MKTKSILLLFSAFLFSFSIQAQEVDISVLNQGIKEHIQEKTKAAKDSLQQIQQQLDSLKKNREQEIFLKNLQTQFESDRTSTILAIRTQNNDFQIAQQELESIKGAVNNKKIEFFGLFTDKDPIPYEQKTEVEKDIKSLSDPLEITNDQFDQEIIVNERYNQAQKDSLRELTLQYRQYVALTEEANKKIGDGNNLIKKIDGYISNRKSFLSSAEKIQKEYLEEATKLQEKINLEDSLITVKRKQLADQTKDYQQYKTTIIVIKDGKLEVKEKQVFDLIEQKLANRSTDSIIVPVDSVSSKYFKEQYDQLVKLNLELSNKKKTNLMLLSKIQFIQGINMSLKNSIDRVYQQELKSYETVVKEQELLKKKLNDAQNGIFEQPNLSQPQKEKKEPKEEKKEEITNEKDPPKTKWWKK